MITKTDVRKDFGYIRMLLQQANYQLTSNNFDEVEASEIANELIAAATVFSEWVEQQK
jgi:hypothetical protein